MQPGIHLFEIKKDKRERLSSWFRSLMRELHFDALIALEHRTIGREFGSIVQIGGKDYAIFFIDHPDNLKLANSSTEITDQHEQIKKECLVFPPRKLKLDYDLTQDLF